MNSKIFSLAATFSFTSNGPRLKLKAVTTAAHDVRKLNAPPSVEEGPERRYNGGKLSSKYQCAGWISRMRRDLPDEVPRYFLVGWTTSTGRSLLFYLVKPPGSAAGAMVVYAIGQHHRIGSAGMASDFRTILKPGMPYRLISTPTSIWMVDAVLDYGAEIAMERKVACVIHGTIKPRRR